MDYEAVIGLEVHPQPLIDTDRFCGCPVDAASGGRGR